MKIEEINENGEVIQRLQRIMDPAQPNGGALVAFVAPKMRNEQNNSKASNFWSYWGSVKKAAKKYLVPALKAVAAGVASLVKSVAKHGLQLAKDVATGIANYTANKYKDAYNNSKSNTEVAVRLVSSVVAPLAVYAVPAVIAPVPTLVRGAVMLVAWKAGIGSGSYQTLKSGAKYCSKELSAKLYGNAKGNKELHNSSSVRSLIISAAA